MNSFKKSKSEFYLGLGRGEGVRFSDFLQRIQI